MNPVAIGPFLFSMGVLALLTGVVAGQLTAGSLARRGQGDAGNAAYMVLALALVAARIAFVVRLWPAYAAHPWDMLNVRDGGFDPVAGVLVLVLATFALAALRRRIRLPLLVAVGVGAAVWGGVMVSGTLLDRASHPPLPHVAVHGLDGRDQSTSSWRGRPLVINFWATWCPPCKREMPVLAQAQATHPGVRFVFADQAEGADQVRAFLRDNGLKLRDVVIDSGALSGYYRIRGFPTTLFIAPDGRLRDFHVGELSHATLQASLRRIAPQASGP